MSKSQRLDKERKRGVQWVVFVPCHLSRREQDANAISKRSSIIGLPAHKHRGSNFKGDGVNKYLPSWHPLWYPGIPLSWLVRHTTYNDRRNNRRDSATAGLTHDQTISAPKETTDLHCVCYIPAVGRLRILYVHRAANGCVWRDHLSRLPGHSDSSGSQSM